MIDAKTFTATVMKETDMHQKVKACVQSKCESVRNFALAKMNQGDPLLHSEGTKSHLES